MADISKAGVRSKLAQRREPYWNRVAAGAFVGLYKGKQGDSWVARYRGADGKQRYQSLDTAKTYDEADAQARLWFASCGIGLSRALSVEAVCRRYVASLALTKGAEQAHRAEGFLRRRVYGSAFGAIALDRLRAFDVEQWRDGLLAHGTKASANRELRQLRAALSYGYRAQLIASDRPWRTVSVFANAENARVRILSLAERRKLLSVARGPIRDFIEMALRTAARPVELARLRVQDVNFEQRTVSLTGFKGRGGVMRARQVPITDELLPLLRRLTSDKLPSAPVFEYRVRSTAYAGDFKVAARAAGLPDIVTMYCARHTAISQWLAHGVDVQTVSKIAGVSIPVISAFYGKFIPAHAHERLSAIKVL